MRGWARTRINLTLVVWALSLLAPLVPQSTSASSNFTYDTRVTYHVNADSTTDVVEHYSITNNTERLYLTDIKLTVPSANIAELIVTYDDGTAIVARSSRQRSSKPDLQFDSTQVDIKFPRPIFGGSMCAIRLATW
jgi:hypothetical protein